ncbi:SDR family NAD(P)-dependent oxidoreductase [Aspergillus stella-maris]|uniref:SDR family NAD(P)-dependent oxidoreductase n=1 Tax=Aspergillus stella-maris TaxID=1810926 RepID=UPI003CCCE67B
MTESVKPPCYVSGTAFITGGASGIGKSVAHLFAKNGIENLALADVSISNLEAVHAKFTSAYPNIKIETFTVDVTKEDQIAAAVQSTAEKFGRIDISIHGAGISGPLSGTHDLELQGWQAVIDVNQTGVMLCDKWVVKQMLTQELRPGYEGRGIIVNIASMFGVKASPGSMGAVAYAASKHAVVAISKVDAKTYADHGIRINAICPGYVDTPLIQKGLETGALAAEIEKTPLKRPARPEEIADAVLFLSSRMSSYMCAAALVVDGGYTA